MWLCPVTEGVLENVDLRLTMRGGELLMFERNRPEFLHEGRHCAQMWLLFSKRSNTETFNSLKCFYSENYTRQTLFFYLQLSPKEHLYVQPTSTRAVIYSNMVLVCFCRPVLPSITGGQWRSAVRWIQWEPVMWLCKTSVPMLSIHLVEPVSIFLTHTQREANNDTEPVNMQLILTSCTFKNVLF